MIKTEGILTIRDQMGRGDTIVRFTSDAAGETLSLSFQDEIMISVAFEQIEQLIKQTREGLKEN